MAKWAWLQDDLPCCGMDVQQKRKEIGDEEIGQNQDQEETPSKILLQVKVKWLHITNQEDLISNLQLFYVDLYKQNSWPTAVHDIRKCVIVWWTVSLSQQRWRENHKPQKDLVPKLKCNFSGHSFKEMKVSSINRLRSFAFSI